jgi:hypothetical protein
MSAVYINSAACISVQDTLNENFFQNLKPENSSQVLKAIEPNYKNSFRLQQAEECLKR